MLRLMRHFSEASRVSTTFETSALLASAALAEQLHRATHNLILGGSLGMLLRFVSSRAKDASSPCARDARRLRRKIRPERRYDDCIVPATHWRRIQPNSMRSANCAAFACGDFAPKQRPVASALPARDVRDCKQLEQTRRNPSRTTLVTQHGEANLGARTSCVCFRHNSGDYAASSRSPAAPDFGHEHSHRLDRRPPHLHAIHARRRESRSERQC